MRRRFASALAALLMASLVGFAEAATPQPASEPGPRRAVVTLGGDCALGPVHQQSKFKNNIWAIVERNGMDWLFSGLAETFSQDDLTLVNLECALTDETKRVKKTFNIKAPGEYAAMLPAASVEAVNLANNHTYDYGEAGYWDTVAALDEHGVAHSGLGELATYDCGGVLVGMTGYTYPFKSSIEKRVAADVAELREQGCDIVIASFHWGTEGKSKANDTQRKLGRAAIRAGADLVVGHHPHVLQGIEQYRGKYILYSLGNLVFGAASDYVDRETFMARVTFEVDDDGSVSCQLGVIPTLLTAKKKGTDYRPVIAEGADQARIAKRIARLSPDAGEYQVLP
ncbi:MAG: CapA family protein [Clostridiales bacterium]|nr:CapA family protein [Clostridiales bacterium]